MNEVNISATLSAQKNNAAISRSEQGSLDMAGRQMTQLTQPLTAGVWTLVDIGKITGAPSKLLVKNLDATNYVELAADAAGATITDKLLPDDFVLRSPVAVIYARAHAADCDLYVTATEA